MPRTPPRDDGLGDLLRHAIAGDEQAYRRFLGDVSVMLRPFVRRWTRSGNDADVEDLLQEVLVAIHTKRHTWREGEPVAPWLYAIARYKAIDGHRRRSKHASVDIAAFEEVLDDPATVPNAVAHDVDKALKSLNGRQRDVVRSISVEGRSIDDTADSLGMSNGAVRVAFHRGLSAIAEKFGRN